MDSYSLGLLGGIVNVFGLNYIFDIDLNKWTLNPSLKQRCVGLGLITLPTLAAVKLDPSQYASGLLFTGLSGTVGMGIVWSMFAKANVNSNAVRWGWFTWLTSLAVGPLLAGGPALVVSTVMYLRSRP
jgi:hypothetical protein